MSMGIRTIICMRQTNGVNEFGNYISYICIMPGYCMGVVGSSIISILHSISMVGHFEKEFVFLPYNFMYEFSIYVRSWIDLWCHSVYKMSEILFQFTLEPTNCDWIYW